MVAGQLYIAVNFYSDDACQNIIPGEGTSQGNVNCVAGSWLILSGSWTVPAGALSMLVGVAVASATQAGKYFYIDSCSLKPVVPGQQLQLGNGLQALGSGATQINNGSTIGFNVGGQVIFLNVQSLPSLPTIAGGNSYYPVGSVVQLSSTGVLYQNVGNVWVTPQSPAQMVAGALAAGVTIAASEVTAGAFVGSTMTLNLNGIITTLGNVYDNAYGAYAGVMVQSTANTLYRALLFNEGLVAFQPNGNQAVSIIGAVGGGNISVQNASGVTTFSVTGQVGQCSATQFIANGSSGRTGTITLSSISQIQVVGGLVVGWS